MALSHHVQFMCDVIVFSNYSNVRYYPESGYLGNAEDVGALTDQSKVVLIVSPHTLYWCVWHVRSRDNLRIRSTPSGVKPQDVIVLTHPGVKPYL